MLTPTYHNRNLFLSKACQSAFVMWMQNKWLQFRGNSERNLNLQIVPTLEDLKSFKHQQGNPTFPYGLIAVAGTQLNTDWGGYTRRFSHIMLGKDIESGLGRISQLVPIKLGYGMSFRSDDLNDLNDFLTLLYSTSPGPYLNLMMQETGFTIGFKTTYPPDMDFAFQSSEDGKYHKMDLSLVMNSWIGQYRDIGLIKTIIIKTYDKIPAEGKLELDTDDGEWYPKPLTEQEKTPATSFQSDYWTFTSRG